MLHYETFTVVDITQNNTRVSLALSYWNNGKQLPSAVQYSPGFGCIFPTGNARTRCCVGLFGHTEVWTERSFLFLPELSSQTSHSLPIVHIFDFNTYKNLFSLRTLASLKFITDFWLSGFLLHLVHFTQEKFLWVTATVSLPCTHSA